jgi:small subunit ribosomal protein S8
MSMTDPIADMLTRIRNASAQKHSYVDMPVSKVKTEIARVLKGAHFIRDHEKVKIGNHEVLRVHLRYIRENTPAITGLKRISKGGLRVYVPKDEISAMERGLGMVILSTPKGVLAGSDARKEQTGGEVLCKVW